MTSHFLPLWSDLHLGSSQTYLMSMSVWLLFSPYLPATLMRMYRVWSSSPVSWLWRRWWDACVWSTLRWAMDCPTRSPLACLPASDWAWAWHRPVRWETRCLDVLLSAKLTDLSTDWVSWLWPVKMQYWWWISTFIFSKSLNKCVTVWTIIPCI